MKKRFILSMAAVALAAVGGMGLCACSDKPADDDDPPSVDMYSVSYDGAGTIEVPQTDMVTPYTEITVADGVNKTGYTFNGWLFSDNVYNGGDKFTVVSDTVFTAQWTANTYTVKFDGNGGSGAEMPDITFTYDIGMSLPECLFMRGSADFIGWAFSADGEALFSDGQNVKNLSAVNGDEITLYAMWREPAAIGFSQAEYFYDKAGGEDAELPVNLLGSNVHAVELDGVELDSCLWEYDAEKRVVSIAYDYMVLLTLGDHTVKLITDSQSDVVPMCKLTAENSIVSAFDNTDRVISYGVDLELDYAVSGDVTVSKLVSGNVTVPTDMYSFADGKLTISGEWIQKYINKSEFIVYLSNNDTYRFNIYNNTVFYSDYDVTTQHNDMQSNTGQNPMYQYAGNVEIVDAPTNSGMSGKVLKITPNTTEVLYNCNGYITLAADNFNSTWRKGGFKSGKYYAVSFDYYTVGTSVGEFAYRTINGSYSKQLILGESGDNTLHRFSDIIPYDAIDGTGLLLWAKFLDGGGEVYVDNFAVIELDKAMEVGVVPDSTYLLGSDNDYGDIIIKNNGLVYELYLGDDKLEIASVDADGTVTLSAAEMSKFKGGSNTVRVVTPIYETSVTVRVVDNRKAELLQTNGGFEYYGNENLKLFGNFDTGVVVTSLKQKTKHEDGGYPKNGPDDGEWEFWHGDTDTDYKEFAELKSGLNGTGYLEIDSGFLKKFYGTTEFEVEFSNGNAQTFTVKSDAVFVSNYDETYMIGYLNGGRNLNVLHSGSQGATADIRVNADGNKAFYITDTSASEQPNLFTFKFHDHVWDWFKVTADPDKLIRITFDYRISDVSDVYLLIMSAQAQDAADNFYGDWDVVPVNGYYELRKNLICDGELHTFDSGWFTYSSVLRMTRIVCPKFDAADGRFVMFDDYCITQLDYTPQTVDYKKGQTEDCAVLPIGRDITSITYKGEDYLLKSGDKISLDKSKLEKLDFGEYKFEIETAAGALPFFVTVKGSVDITQTEYEYVYGSGDLQLSGTVGNSQLASARKKGSFYIAGHEYDDSPTELDLDHFVIADGKLTIKKSLLDSLYLTTSVTLNFLNDESVTVKINSNVRFFTDLDGTNVMHPLRDGNGNGYNGHMSQDTSQISVIDDGTGNHVVRYCTYDATLGHAKNDVHNMIFDIAVGWGSEGGYAKFLHDGSPIIAEDKDYIISFDYKIVNADGCDVTYAFRRFGVSDEAIDGTEGTFTTKIVGGQQGLQTVGICCTVVGGMEDCYMLIDNYRVVEIEKE